MPLASAALLAAALAAGPAGPRAPTLRDAAADLPDAVLDLRYATAKNPAGRPLYAAPRCLLLPAVAARLQRAAADLRTAGFRLVLWDCYRPASAQRELWQARPDKRWVADPARGSNHSRGSAVDLSLASADGKLVEMPTDHDAFDARARPDAVAGLSPAALEHRRLLREAMERAGFRQNRGEWWHYDAPEGRGAPLLDLPVTVEPAR